jgi:parallel beta-helix repeat protein
MVSYGTQEESGVTVTVARPAGATVTDTPNVAAAISNLAAAVSLLGAATLLFQDGTYQLDSNSAVIRSLSNFAVRSSGRTVLAQAPNRTALPNNTTGNILTIADSTDFTVDGITFDALRDTLSPISPLTAQANSGQPSVTVAAGQGARYVPGQYLYVFGGLGTSEQNQSEGFGIGTGVPLTVQAVSAGAGSGGGDLITFTGNLTSTYTHVSGALVSDAFGPYACAGAYVTPYQCGTANAVAGRSLSGEDQQNGIHLISCQRFTIRDCTGRNTWESQIKMGTGEATTSLTDGCTQGDVTDCKAYHGYDQGISAWVCSQISIKGCTSNSSGWAGVCLTASDYCTVVGNVILSPVYQVPGDLTEGNGIAVEGGQHCQIAKNIINTPFNDGIRILMSPLWWGLTSGTYPTITAFLREGTTAGTSIQVSATANLQVGGLYSVVDGPQTEAFTVATIIDGTHVTWTTAVQFSHVSGCYVSRRVAQENILEGNSITGPQNGSGIRHFPAVRSVVANNTISGWTSAGNGIGMVTSNASMPTYLGADGSQIDDNVIGGSNGGTCIQVQAGANLLIRGNQLYGPGAAANAMQLEGITDSLVEGNRITDVINGAGLVLLANTTPSVAPARVIVRGNIIRRCHEQGMIITVADSLAIIENEVQSCGSTAGIDLQGVTRSSISNNVCNSNAGTGILLENSGTTYCLYNRVIGNTCRDDGSGVTVFSGGSVTQQHGIVENGSGNNNIFTGNECDSNAVDQLTTVGAGSAVFANIISGVVTAGTL